MTNETMLVAVLAGLCLALLIVVIAILVSSHLRAQREQLPLVGADVRTERQRRSLPVVIECASCAHWDLEEGQANLKQYPTFMQVAAHRSPASMSSKAVVDHHGRVVGQQEPGPNGKTTPLKAKWEDFGACSERQEMTYEHYQCEKYQRRADPDAEPPESMYNVSGEAT